jgi:hypothetical protein
MPVQRLHILMGLEFGHSGDCEAFALLGGKQPVNKKYEERYPVGNH